MHLGRSDDINIVVKVRPAGECPCGRRAANVETVARQMQAHEGNADFLGFGDMTQRHACGQVGRVPWFGTFRVGMLTSGDLQPLAHGAIQIASKANLRRNSTSSIS
ncbi:hypothetical protein [Rhizobium sp. LjRoot258]|uniref:hypothetical protein n=1 Tax=Rhizobium sp. LjRoot258 TaxID=3342299 RepID=UPI003ED0A66F